MIAAMTHERIIGHGDKIPWHIPEDFKYFKRQTLEKPIIMGRTTFESIHQMKGTNPNEGPALPKRLNIIVTGQTDYTAPQCEVCHSIKEALDFAKKVADTEVMVIGGGKIYDQFLPHAERLYVTWIDGDHKGDTYFPKWNDKDWTLTSEDPHDGYNFTIYDRKET